MNMYVGNLHPGDLVLWNVPHDRVIWFVVAVELCPDAYFVDLLVIRHCAYATSIRHQQWSRYATCFVIQRAREPCTIDHP